MSLGLTPSLCLGATSFNLVGQGPNEWPIHRPCSRCSGSNHPTFVRSATLHGMAFKVRCIGAAWPSIPANTLGEGYNGVLSLTMRRSIVN